MMTYELAKKGGYGCLYSPIPSFIIEIWRIIW